MRMRVWIMMGVGALMLATAVVPSGAWGATMDDVKQEMAQNKTPWWGTRLVMYVPMDQMGMSGQMHMSMSELCAGGGRLRPMSEGAAGTDWGPLPEGKEYTVQIFMRDGGGYDTWQYSRKVSVPDCK